MGPLKHFALQVFPDIAKLPDSRTNVSTMGVRGIVTAIHRDNGVLGLTPENYDY